MVDFSLNDEERQIRDTVRAFIEREVMPLEPEVLRSEPAGRGSSGTSCATCS
jgi:acyl-CoA dehydrogenase